MFCNTQLTHATGTPVKNSRILLAQNFTASMLLLIISGDSYYGENCSPQNNIDYLIEFKADRLTRHQIIHFPVNLLASTEKKHNKNQEKNNKQYNKPNLLQQKQPNTNHQTQKY